MLPPDLAFAQYFNATAKAYTQRAPAYISYRERTHIQASGPFVKADRDINRMITVRQADNMAIMQDLPNGGTTQGQAFPIIPYFDPLSNFGFHYLVNLKAINIDLTRSAPPILELPQTDPSVDATLYYLPFWKPAYGAKSSDAFPQFTVEPVVNQKGVYYPAEVDIDSGTGLPSHIEIKVVGDNLDVKLDYSIIEGHWIITHGLMYSAQGPFHGTSETTFDQFTFPSTAPDARLQ